MAIRRLQKKMARMRSRLKKQRGRKRKRAKRRVIRKKKWQKFKKSKFGKTLGTIGKGLGGFALGGPMGAAAALAPAAFKGIRKLRAKRRRRLR